MTEQTPTPFDGGPEGAPADSSAARAAQEPPTAPAQGAAAPADPPGQSETARIGTKAVSITATVIGACALVLSGAGTAIATVGQSLATGSTSQELGASVDGITAIDIDHRLGTLIVEFDDVDEASLSATSSGDVGDWRFQRDGHTLSLSRPDDAWGFDNTNWLRGWGIESTTTLTLPESLAGVDLDVDAGAGEVFADGEFGDIAFDLGAGSLEFEGSAASLGGEVGAGGVIAELADVREVDVAVSAGHFGGDLTGAAPESVLLDVSAGGADVTLPDEEYDVRIDRSAGDVETNNLRTSPEAPRIVDVRVSAGGVELYAD